MTLSFSGRMMLRTLAAVCGVTVLFLSAAWGLDAWLAHVQLAEARREMARGDYRTAAHRLLRLETRRPTWGEVGLRLGECRAATGDAEAALAAWARVPRFSPEAGPAALRRAALAMDRGRFGDAEQALRAAIALKGPTRDEATHRLIQLLWREARFEDARAEIEARWHALETAGQLTTSTCVDLLRGHLSLDLEVFPVDEIARGLELPGTRETGDSELVLARARWALRAGRLEDARALIAGCLPRCTDDSAVWRVDLDWARAAGRLDEAEAALPHLTARDFRAAEIARLRAWIAAQRGDAVQESSALEEAVRLEPGAVAPLERLAELAIQRGEAERAVALRARKQRLDEATLRYRRLFEDDALAARPLEMARLAHTLNRRFEARAFLWLAERRHEHDPALHRALGSSGARELERTGTNPRETLADRLGLVPPRSAQPARTDDPMTRRVDFSDDAQRAGLSFVYDQGATPERQLPETMSGGVGLLDYDGDGWIDVYVVQGGHFPPPREGRANGDRLFHNRGDGTFEDATARSGLAACAGGYGLGVAVGDYDNDGRPDLFVARWRAYALYHNQGDGTFASVTESAGLGGDRDWPTSAAFGDFDGDGDLDLYVCHYLKWDAEQPRLCRERAGAGHRYCDPRLFEALPDHIFRNDRGRFTDVTRDAGVVDQDGRGLGVLAADLDGDGRIDLFVANDGTANAYLHNLGGFHFEDRALAAGVAGNAAGGYQAGMGVACGDLDGDLLPDLLVTNFYGESTTFYRNLGSGFFADHTASVGLAAATRSLLGFGIALVDAENDTHLDVITANGHVNDDRPRFPYAMPPQLLLGGTGGHLRVARPGEDLGWQAPVLGRGLAAGDLDNDGRIDAIILPQGTPLVYLHNRSAGNHFLTFRLEGTASSRDAVGAVVTVSAGGRRQRVQRVGGGSYQSASDGCLHFGLGMCARVDSVEVRWPSGRVSRFESLNVDTGYLLVEGADRPAPLGGFGRH